MVKCIFTFAWASILIACLGVDFQIEEIERLYKEAYKKGADQLRGYLRICFRMCKTGVLMTRLI